MTLSFKTQIDGEPTYFVHKIWNGLENILKISPDRLCIDWFGHLTSARIYFAINPDLAPKIHTIREDRKERWKPGTWIHFVINNRTPDRLQFAPVVKCVSVQKIKITYDNIPPLGRCASISVDGKYLFPTDIYLLAKNDGFDSIGDLLEYFNKDFEGKIVHWTDFKY